MQASKPASVAGPLASDLKSRESRFSFLNLVYSGLKRSTLTGESIKLELVGD